MTEFEKLIRELIGPFGSQVLRPWMTDLDDPESANVFVVGINQATTYPANMLERHIDALFNRNGETNRSLYSEIRSGASSPTRKATEKLTRALQEKGLKVIETNVFCSSTPKYKDLTITEKSRGFSIFQTVYSTIQPKVLIVHGEPTRKELNRRMGWAIPKPQLPPQAPIVSWQKQVAIIPQSTLSPAPNRGFNNWGKAHSEKHFKAVAELAEKIVRYDG